MAKPCCCSYIINRVLTVAEAVIGHPPVVIGLNIPRIELNSPVKIRNRLGVVAEVYVGNTAAVMDKAISIGNFQGVTIQGDAVSPVPDLSPGDEEEAQEAHRRQGAEGLLSIGPFLRGAPERPMRR